MDPDLGHHRWQRAGDPVGEGAGDRRCQRDDPGCALRRRFAREPQRHRDRDGVWRRLRCGARRLGLVQSHRRQRLQCQRRPAVAEQHRHRQRRGLHGSAADAAGVRTALRVGRWCARGQRGRQRRDRGGHPERSWLGRGRTGQRRLGLLLCRRLQRVGRCWFARRRLRRGGGCDRGGHGHGPEVRAKHRLARMGLRGKPLTRNGAAGARPALRQRRRQ